MLCSTRPVAMLFGSTRTREQRSAAEVTKASNQFPSDEADPRTRFSVLIGDERRRRPIAGAPRNAGVRATIQFLKSAASESNPIHRHNVASGTRDVSSRFARVAPDKSKVLNQCAKSAAMRRRATLCDESRSRQNFFWRPRRSRRQEKPLPSPYC